MKKIWWWILVILIILIIVGLIVTRNIFKSATDSVINLILSCLV